MTVAWRKIKPFARFQFVEMHLAMLSRGRMLGQIRFTRKVSITKHGGFVTARRLYRLNRLYLKVFAYPPYVCNNFEGDENPSVGWKLLSRGGIVC